MGESGAPKIGDAAFSQISGINLAIILADERLMPNILLALFISKLGQDFFNDFCVLLLCLEQHVIAFLIRFLSSRDKEFLTGRRSSGVTGEERPLTVEWSRGV